MYIYIYIRTRKVQSLGERKGEEYSKVKRKNEGMVLLLCLISTLQPERPYQEYNNFNQHSYSYPDQCGMLKIKSDFIYFLTYT